LNDGMNSRETPARWLDAAPSVEMETAGPAASPDSTRIDYGPVNFEISKENGPDFASPTARPVVLRLITKA
jgi:hypothetical protein